MQFCPCACQESLSQNALVHNGMIYNMQVDGRSYSSHCMLPHLIAYRLHGMSDVGFPQPSSIDHYGGTLRGGFLELDFACFRSISHDQGLSVCYLLEVVAHTMQIGNYLWRSWSITLAKI